MIEVSGINSEDNYAHSTGTQLFFPRTFPPCLRSDEAQSGTTVAPEARGKVGTGQAFRRKQKGRPGYGAASHNLNSY